MPRDIDLIVIHCSASPNGDALFRPQAGSREPLTALDVIDGWHRERGFQRSGPHAQAFNPRYQHIGYHYVIACNGALFTGRSLNEQGAHAQGYNARSVGICMTGTDRYTAAQWARLAALLAFLTTAPAGPKLNVPLRAPRRVAGVLRGGVCGHRDLSPDVNGNGRIEPFEWLKTCPGFDVSAWLERGMQPLEEHLCA